MRRFLGEPCCASIFVRAGTFCLAYFAAAELGHALSRESQDQLFVALWPPAGLLLAILTVSRYSLWIPLILAAWVANLASDVLLHDTSVLASLGHWVAHTVESCLGAWLLRHFVGLPFTLTRLKEVVALVGFAVLFSPLAGATLRAWFIVGGVADPAYKRFWQTWWIGDALGVLLMAPVVFTWMAGSEISSQQFRPKRFAEISILFVGIILVTECVYGNWLPRYFQVPIFILPFLLWAGLRLGPHSAANALFVVALIGTWNVMQGRGPYTVESDPLSDQVLRAQGALAGISLSVLLLAANMAERNQAEQDRSLLLAKLQQALAEIKTLRGFIPICGWCKSIRDDKDFWHSVEDYISDHSEVQFSHGICPECLAKALVDLEKSDT
mgnify:CR=1 FL=1